MVYPDNFAGRTGFDAVLEQCLARCTTSRSRQLLSAEGFSTDAAEIVRRQSLADEVRRMLTTETDAPDGDFFDIDDIVAKARVEGTFLDTAEAARLGLTLTSSAAVVNFVHGRDAASYPYMSALCEGVQPLPHIVSEVVRIMDEHGNIRDTASDELAAVRREIRSREGQVSKRLQAILQSAKSAGIVDAEASVSVRDGRAVIPVSASNKRKLQGFIHDESATGKTFYIEPVEIVELNNELKELEYRERREVVRILTAFTDLVRADIDDVATVGEYVAQVDMIRAKARWAVDNGAVMPILADSSRTAGLVLRRARHPLLEQNLRRSGRSIVPLDAQLDGDNRILVISGPNAGGKSVCLKTVGLLQYMFQCGFPVPASENSEMPVFSKIYIDIGDQQSIENDLSTYSSHLLNMKAMLAGADSSTLILIDEFGSGTEPVIGAAIAESILERFVASGCYGIITTHYSNIKYYASNTRGVVNGAMMFDVQNIRPLFSLETGRPGSSFAIEIARKIGLPESIIASASDKAGSDHMNIERQLREIARDRNYWAQKRERIRVADRRVEELEKNYGEQLARIREERNAILRQAKEQARAIVSEANRQIETTIRTIRESQAEREQTRSIRRSFDSFRAELEQENDGGGDDERISREMARIERRQQRRTERVKNRETAAAAAAGEAPVPPAPRKVEEGAKVRLEGQDAAGTVVSLRGRKAQVAFGQMLTTVDVSRLTVISSAEFKRATRTDAPRTVISADISRRRLEFRSSIDIRGQRVAEALEQVQALVDDALMVGVESVTILHGKGTGALKEEVRRLLRSIPEVANATDDHPDRGGSGITVVTFSL